jgi:hypothetical protein
MIHRHDHCKLSTGQESDMSKVTGSISPQRPSQNIERVSSTRIFLISTIPAILTLALLHLLGSSHNPFRIPLFDDSAALLEGYESPLIRWDAVHFTAIASRGYEYEQQLAFQPGWQGVLWLVGRCWRLIDDKASSIEAISKGGSILMVLLAGWRGLALYESAVLLSWKASR